ncbi:MULTISPECIES: 2'-5' RNA ligase family protein [Leptolyngbya]|uniref:2'-5' RNA ligase family protein n=1 Tax=Leptolyngbya TaxID=47251 RepID=UPI0016831AB3|nr:2'-5' RNA ligase family protein [Leptolyngbya sp. FACHB-1624]MBD1858569.1 2'-5' RNA ligase family protein [Leptolyngbya sp. FACHB-1624]
MNAEHLFFIALLPPQAIQNYATEVKCHFDQYYDSRHAFNSPPHITLFPPFKWRHQRLDILTESLATFTTKHPAISITLDGFGAFPPRVIFIHVDRSDALLNLHQKLIEHLETSIELSDPRENSRPYAPHMTVAFRDLTPENFKLAWKEFKAHPLHFEFDATHLTLLKHDGQRWQIHAEFPFKVER